MPNAPSMAVLSGNVWAAASVESATAPSLHGDGRLQAASTGCSDPVCLVVARVDDNCRLAGDCWRLLTLQRLLFLVVASSVYILIQRVCPSVHF
eukprot:m.160979 g.160979  ORF g.160979 m.160979 type:complete len:94 (-) comp14567_c1_seq1:98-379(-)